jgi:DNA-binding transcriptional LysR family regulator
MVESPQHPVDLDLRVVRHFTVVAEHRHFGRAAAALRVAQSSLSRQVLRLEQDLDAQLFDRTPQGTELTEAGAVFLPGARALLRSAAQARGRCARRRRIQLSTTSPASRCQGWPTRCGTSTGGLIPAPTGLRRPVAPL